MIRQYSNLHTCNNFIIDVLISTRSRLKCWENINSYIRTARTRRIRSCPKLDGILRNNVTNKGSESQIRLTRDTIAKLKLIICFNRIRITCG